MVVEGGWRDAMTSSGQGGGCAERGGFYTKGTAAPLSLGIRTASKSST